MSNVSYRGGATTSGEYVIVVEVPSMAEHHEHDSDPDFQEFDRLADEFQPEGPLVFGGDLIHSVG